MAACCDWLCCGCCCAYKEPDLEETVSSSTNGITNDEEKETLKLRVTLTMQLHVGANPLNRDISSSYDASEKYATVGDAAKEGWRLTCIAPDFQAARQGIGIVNHTIILKQTLFFERPRHGARPLDVMISKVRVVLQLATSIGRMHADAQFAQLMPEIAKRAADGWRLDVVALSGETAGNVSGFVGKQGEIEATFDCFFSRMPKKPAQYAYDAVLESIRLQVRTMGAAAMQQRAGDMTVSDIIAKYCAAGRRLVAMLPMGVSGGGMVRIDLTQNLLVILERRLDAQLPPPTHVIIPYPIRFRSKMCGGLSVVGDYFTLIAEMGKRGWSLETVQQDPSVRRASMYSMEQIFLLLFSIVDKKTEMFR